MIICIVDIIEGFDTMKRSGGRLAHSERTRGLRWIGLLLPLMLAENIPVQGTGNAMIAQQPPAVTIARQERLKERDRLGKEANKLRSEGNWPPRWLPPKACWQLRRSAR